MMMKIVILFTIPDGAEGSPLGLFCPAAALADGHDVITLYHIGGKGSFKSWNDISKITQS